MEIRYKKCTCCNEIKPLWEFSIARGHLYYRNRCKMCYKKGRKKLTDMEILRKNMPESYPLF